MTRLYTLISITIIFCLSQIQVFAQSDKEKILYYPEVVHEDWFKLIPPITDHTPDWAKVMYEDSENFEKIERLKREYYNTHPFKKTVHTQNYKYWLKTVSPYLNDEGKVSMPLPGTEFKKYLSERNSQETDLKSQMMAWSNIGPNITYKSDGSLNTRPTQANVYCLAVAPSNTSVIYAGMETGGIFKSTDKGLNWSPVTYDYAIGNIQDIKVDPKDEDIVYASRGSEVYKTTNGGNSWTQIYIAPDVVECFMIHSTDTDTIYAATRNGLMKSLDGGTSWNSIFSGYIYDIEAKPGSDDTLYIAIKNDVLKRPEIYKSNDAGTSWTLKDNGFYSPSDLGVATVYGCKVGVTPADPDRLYAGIIATGKAGDNGWIGVYYSLDEGDTWQEDSGFDGGPYAPGNDPATNWYVAGYSSGYHQGWYNFDIDVSHTDPDKIWIGTVWFCESGNKGGNIEYIRGSRNLEMHADIQDIDVHGSDIWIASDGGINYSNDECLTVDIRMNGITASDYWGFGHGWNEDVYVGGRYHNGNAAFHENYGAGNSLFLGGAETATGYVNPLDNKKSYFSDITDKHIPNALTGTPQNIPNLGMYPTQSYYHFSYSEVEWDPRYANHVYIGKDQSLFKSTDGGATFDTLYTFPGDVRRFEISRDNPDYIYIIVFLDYWNWSIYRSTDGGVSFNEINTPPYSGGSWRNLSFTLNPFDKDEIWTASNSSSDGNKVFSSTDGGSSWANRYTATIAGEAFKDLIYHKDAEGSKVYGLTNDNFYYYDTSTSEWANYSSGLPVTHTGFMMLPFYRDNKIRMASAKGIWEVPFVSSSQIDPMPMASADTLYCSRDTLFLDSYSIAHNSGLTYTWNISPAPQWISNINERNPKVVLGSEGNFDISLTIQSNGTDYTHTEPDMVTLIDNCSVDPFAGSALNTEVNGESVVVQDANLNNITHFTVTGWWKPAGGQQGFAALWSSGDWCAHCDYTEGLIIDYFGSRVWYKWPGNASNWGSNSGMTIPLDEWSYVALVITPDGATMYLNEDKYEHNIPLDPGDISSYHLGYGHYSKSFIGQIDEVTLWDKALTEEEVRRLRHITKENAIINDPNLIAYYQFNNLVGGSQIMDLAGTRHGILHPDAELVDSDVPVGGGKANIQAVSTNQHQYDFPDANASVYMSDCEDVIGDQVVFSRLDVRPNILPNNNASPNTHWIINYYGNNTFPTLDSIVVHVSDSMFIDDLTDINDIVIHERPVNSNNADWIAKAYLFDNSNYNLKFDRVSRITGPVQLAVTDDAPAFAEIDPGKPCFIDTFPFNLISFDGTATAYATTPDDPALDFGTSQDFSVSFWFRTTTNSEDAVLAAKKDWDSGLNPGWVISTLNGKFWVNLGDGNARIDMQPSQPINDGNWHYAALTCDRSGLAKLYLDGTAIDSSDITDIGNLDNGFPLTLGADGEFDYRIAGDIEEFRIFDTALTRDEVRLMRHLIHKPADTNIIVYYQFNHDIGYIYDKMGSHHLNLGSAAQLAESDCPVGGGISAQESIFSAGTYDFPPTEVSLTFPSSGIYPDGQLVATRLNIAPDTLNNNSGIFNNYWIINNYGDNNMFTTPSSLTLGEIQYVDAFTTESSYHLFMRSENTGGPVWVMNDIADNISLSDRSLEFDSGLNLTSATQLAIDNINGLMWIGTQSQDWSTTANWSSGTLPLSTSEVFIPKTAPYHPVLDINTLIKTLHIQKGATFDVPLGRILEVIF